MRVRFYKFLVPLTFLLTAFASSGDRLSEFVSCLEKCTQDKCISNPKPLPLVLRLTFWSCQDNCKYTCQREITEHAKKNGLEIHQYYGKWPFRRFLGTQEPASVAFSALNGYIHYISWKKIDQRVNSSNPAYFWLKLYVVIGVWVWVWSSVFHTRDFIFTERMDYYSAALLVFYLLFIPTMYLLQKQGKRTIKGAAQLLFALYLIHVFYLQFIKFSYSYNMMANALAGLCANVAWFMVSYKLSRERIDKWHIPVVLIVYTDLAFSLEAFDFPPVLDTFDAHSLWHAATIPITFWWYEWLIDVFSSTLHQRNSTKAI